MGVSSLKGVLRLTRLIVPSVASGLVGGCGSSGSPAGYTVGGTIAGLPAGAQLTLLNDGEDQVVVTRSGTFAFAGALASQAAYAVTVNAAPAGQTCTVSGGTGVIHSANVANVVVTCSERAFMLGGAIRGLNAPGLVLENGADSLTIETGATRFALPQPVAYGSSYVVAVRNQPAGAACAVQGGSGTMPAGDVTNVLVNCSDQPFTIGGSVSGLGAATGLVLANGTDTLAVAPLATTFAMRVPITFGTPYQVTVQSTPPGMQCAVSGGSGTMSAGAVNNIAVVCSETTYPVGGSLSGLWAPGLVLANGSDTLSVPTRAGVFTMPTTLPVGAHYAVVVQTQPTGLICAVTNGSGTMGTAPVSDILVGCGSGAYTVGGTITGLSTSGLVLANGADRLAVQANAMSFSMPAAVPGGANYDVTVERHPPAQDCTVSNPSGVVGNADIGSVGVSCVAGSGSVLYALGASSGDGATPYGSLLLGSDGNLYGLAYVGGANGLGAAFRIAPDGSETVLHSFGGGSDGANPHGSLIQASDGNFYGVTAYGGTFGHGVVFLLTASGTETVLYSFGAGVDAQDPYGSLLQASDGRFYGLSAHGGASGLGTVFAISPDGAEAVLYSFGSGSDGQTPFGSLIQGSDGNLYGMTAAGGVYGSGIVFSITLQGAETVLHAFGAVGDGTGPEGSLIQANDGNFYGLTRDGGTNGTGTVFEIGTDGTESVLVSLGAGGDGANPFGDLLQASDGNLYALTRNGGANGAGAVLQLSLSGAESVQYSFAPASGAYPFGSLIEAADSTLYGMTSSGGVLASGTVFRIN